MLRIDRRAFLRGSAAAGAAFALQDCAAPGRGPARSPNEEIRVAVAGVRSRGRSHISGFHSQENVRVVALCDVDKNILAERVAEFEQRGETVDGVVDFRELLDRRDIDVVSLATPNHWHALQSIWACQAGKDVYVEKPVSHNVSEGRQIVRAARKYDRIVQTGTQCRSSQAIGEAAVWLRSGELGRIELARGLCYKPRASIGKVSGPQVVSAAIDYDLWTGPAELKPLMRRHLHYDWHWVFNTGNGDLGNQGVHQMDLCRWVLGEAGLPRAAFALGGRFGYDDDGDTPNTMVSFLDYEQAPILFEVRGLPADRAARESGWGQGMDSYLGARIGAIMHCEGGTLRIPNYSSAVAFDRAGKQIRKWQGADDHFKNFIAAVRSRKRTELTADIEQGHLSSALCHLGNISLQCAGSGQGSRYRVSEAVFEALSRVNQHLRRNEVPGEQLRYGAWLGIDTARERFSSCGDSNPATLKEANARLTRPYREPFVLPRTV